MNTPVQILALSIAAAFAPGGFIYLNELRLRKIAEARLDLARAATEVEKILLKGETKVGEVCHDHLCKAILLSEHQTEFQLNWNPFRQPSEEALARHETLEDELKSNAQVRSVLTNFVPNFSKGFRYTHPFRFAVFFLWVFIYRGGLQMLFAGILLLMKGHDSMKALRRGWKEAKCELAEWSVILSTILADRSQLSRLLRE